MQTIIYAGRSLSLDWEKSTAELAAEHSLDKATVSRLRKKYAAETLLDSGSIDPTQPVGKWADLASFLRAVEERTGLRHGGQAECALACAVDTRTLRRWLSGEKQPSQSNLSALLAWATSAPSMAAFRAGPMGVSADAPGRKISPAKTHGARLAHDLMVRCTKAAARANISVDKWLEQAALAKLGEEEE